MSISQLTFSPFCSIWNNDLVELRPDAKEAVFQHLETGEKTVEKYDMIHVTPPQCAPDFISASPLADEAGWVDVDQHTLQHVRYPNVFSLGDCCSAPNSKTGAAIRKGILEQNEHAKIVVSEMRLTTLTDAAGKAQGRVGFQPLDRLGGGGLEKQRHDLDQATDGDHDQDQHDQQTDVFLDLVMSFCHNSSP